MFSAANKIVNHIEYEDIINDISKKYVHKDGNLKDILNQYGYEKFFEIVIPILSTEYYTMNEEKWQNIDRLSNFLFDYYPVIIKNKYGDSKQIMRFLSLTLFHDTAKILNSSIELFLFALKYKQFYYEELDCVATEIKQNYPDKINLFFALCAKYQKLNVTFISKYVDNLKLYKTDMRMCQPDLFKCHHLITNKFF